MSAQNLHASVLKHFTAVDDPRLDRRKLHQLPDILFITLCGIICGADNWVMVEQFGKGRQTWFKELLELPNGIPSHDTFGDVFAAIDTEQFSQCFSNWVKDLTTYSGDAQVIAIDGKTLRRSADKASKKAAVHMVSAWAQSNALVPGQVKVNDKSNEITAIPRLLKLIDITNCVVTIDAMGCQSAIAEQIIAQGGDYALSLKGNQGTLHDDVRQWFDSKPAPPTSSEDLDAGHGRIEQRRLRVSDDIAWLVDRHPHWKGLKSIIAVEAERYIGENVQRETRYFISSLGSDNPKRLAQVIRAHWAVENSLHWTLDVGFDEDRSRARQGNSAANLAIVRHVALNLLKGECSNKVGIQTKRARAAWDQEYLMKVMASF